MPTPMSTLKMLVKVRHPDEVDTASIQHLINALHRVGDDLEMRDVTLAIEIDILKAEIKQLRESMHGRGIRKPVQETGRKLDLE